MKPGPEETEKILIDAEVTVIYFRALVEKKIPVGAAISLTASYVTARQISAAAAQKPGEPWDDAS